ncbi:MAG: hypothetical protein KJ061_11320 [Vicinamibacteraceae bacterium]|nr:hypothetical protein [Vicinamibacteraceae bacterium]
MTLTSIAIVVTVAAGLYGLHRLLLWAEGRGWIYYRRQSSSRASVGSAMLEVHALMEPSKKHVLEVREEDEARRQEAGEGDT